MDEVKDIVGRVLNQLLQQKPSQGKNIEDIWEKLVDRKIQQHTKIAGLKRDQLIVYVDSSAWLYQVNLLKFKILKDIQVQIPEIKNIHFKAGKAL